MVFVKSNLLKIPINDAEKLVAIRYWQEEILIPGLHLSTVEYSKNKEIPRNTSTINE